MTTTDQQLAASRMLTARLHSLVQRFVEADGIANYDSTLCWGCGEPEAEKLRFKAAHAPVEQREEIEKMAAAARHKEGCILVEARVALSHNEPEILALLANVEREAKVERMAAAAGAVVAQNNDVLRDTMPEVHQAIRELGYALDKLAAVLPK